MKPGTMSESVTFRSSPLAQGRGLKLFHPMPYLPYRKSPLAQGRGLKRAARMARVAGNSRPSRRGVD